MKNSKSIINILALVFSFIFVGCKPDSLVIEIYTSDISLASKGDVIQVPITATFSMMGDDDGTLPQAQLVAMRYLHEKSEFTISKGDWGDVMVIKSKIPMGTISQLETYLVKHHSPFALVIENSNIILNTTPSLESLNQDLSGINFMLDVEKSAKSTILRFIGDMPENPEITAIAVFVDKKPELIFRKKIERRETVEIDFNGEDASVYSEISPQFTIKF